MVSVYASSRRPQTVPRLRKDPSIGSCWWFTVSNTNRSQCGCNEMCLLFLSLAAGVESRETLCLCERGERQLVCLSHRVRARLYGHALAALEASPGANRLDHTPYYGLYLHLQLSHRSAMGSGNVTLIYTGYIYIYLLSFESKVCTFL